MSEKNGSAILHESLLHRPSRNRPLLAEVPDHPPFGYFPRDPLELVEIFLAGIDSQVIKYRCCQVCRGNGVIRDVPGIPIRASVYLPAPNSSARQQGGESMRPMVASRCGINLWRAAKFATANDDRVVQPFSLAQFSHQCRESRIEYLIEFGMGFVIV